MVHSMRNLGKAIGALGRLEFGRLWAELIERLPVWWFRRERAFLFALDAEGIDRGAKGEPLLPDGYAIRQAAFDDLTTYERALETSASESRRRFDGGDLCYAVVRDDAIANITWLHFGPCYIRGLAFLVRAAPTDCYLYGVVTARTFRGQGLYKGSQLALLDVLRQRGTTRILQLVMDGNAPVLATLPKLGYRRIAVLRHSTFLGLQRTRLNDEERGVHSSEWHWCCRGPKGVPEI
jgi:hypothetical protein